MGTKIFDIYSLGHFVCGIIVTSILFPNSPILSLVISNALHLLFELLEKDINPHNGKILESGINHLSDIVFFFVGSLIGLHLTKYMTKHTVIRIILLVVSSLVGIQELGRELFPDKWPIYSAYS